MGIQREPSLVVIQLNGGNDALNTVVPYTNGVYQDSRTAIRLEEEDVIDLDGKLGLHPSLGPVKKLWDEGNVAIVNGIGYPTPNRSHFRSMDIWHTAEPVDVAPDGWLGRAIREIDPNAENVVAGVNFGRGLPRALHCKGVPVASVGNLATYGLMPDFDDTATRDLALNIFTRMYGPREGRDAIMEAIGDTGMSAYLGADILRAAPERYHSSVEYADNQIAQSMKDIAQVMFADVGTRIFYAQHGSYDTHSGELINHANLLNELSNAVGDFFADLEEHGRANDAVVMVFSEFGRRISDNGSGTDHGSGGVAFVMGNAVHGGFYGEYPSLEIRDQVEGDMAYNNDFRGLYSTLLDGWMGLDPHPIVGGTYEQFAMFNGR